MIANKCSIINNVVMHTDLCDELGYFENQRLFELALRSHAIILWDNGGNVGIITISQLKEMHRVYDLSLSGDANAKRHIPSVFWDDCEHASEVIGSLLLGREHELDYHERQGDDQTNS